MQIFLYTSFAPKQSQRKMYETLFEKAAQTTCKSIIKYLNRE